MPVTNRRWTGTLARDAGVPAGKRERAQGGLTLLEVLAATAVVLVTCVAVTAATVASLRAGSRSQAVVAADAALRAEAVRLRALPFFASLPADWDPGQEVVPPSAIGLLFPHADATLNTDDAGYCLTGSLQGSFQTTTEVDGLTLRRTAWMARCEPASWSPVPVGELQGWKAWGARDLPAEALIVRLSTAGADGIAGGRTLVIVVCAASGLVAGGS